MGGIKSRLLIPILAVLLALFVTGETQARENYRGMLVSVNRSMPMEKILAAKETCIQCHTRVTPMVVAQHQAGPHLKAGLDCKDCHGADHRDMPLVTGKKACIKCHQRETEEMLASKHAISWDKMWNNARYSAIPEAMRQQGCARCHDIGVGFKDVKDVRCDYCHTNHEFSVKEARHPAACTTCHMGPDHPQAEAFAASEHGKIFAAAQGWKSAYHQDFQRAGTKGIGELQGLMAELQAEADLLRLLGPVQDGENNKEAVTGEENPRPAYLPFGLGGLLLGLSLAVLLSFVRKKKTGLFTCLLVIIVAGSFLFSVPGEALAWGENRGDQKQCSSCHQEKGRQLKTGGHAGLACLDCHTAGAAINQVRKPETCGRCHNETTGYEFETYLSSPHGVQYQIKGSGPWVPTCADCHLPRGNHSPRSRLAGNNMEFEGMIGEVCLKCHTTDHVIKFNQDKTAIYKAAADLTKELDQVRQDLIDKGILVPINTDETQWQLVNQERLTSREQEAARKLADELDSKTKAGVFEYAVKLKNGTAHVNPDYAHWYGNAYLNLNLAEAKTMARELEMLAERAGYTPGGESSAANWPAILLGGATAGGGFAATTLVINKRRRHISG